MTIASADLVAVAQRIGVQRIADLSALDDLGVHVVAAVRTPLDPASVSVCSGRGATVEAARIGALAEAIERWCAEPRGRIATVHAIEPPGRFVGGAALCPARAPRADDTVAWLRGDDLIDGGPTWLPAQAVFYPCRDQPLWFAPATHGLAAATTIADARLAALLECVERDAYSRAVALASVGRGDACPPVAAERVLGSVALHWLACAQRAGLVVRMRDVTGDTGIPTLLCTVAEPTADTLWAPPADAHARQRGAGPRSHLWAPPADAHARQRGAGPRSHLWAHHGCAAALDAGVAADRALGEALQARLIDIQGAREDLPMQRVAPDPWFLPPPPGGRPPRSVATANDPVELIAGRLVAAGCGPPVAVDLSADDLPLRVVRVVVPGLEVWAEDPTRAGVRMERWCAP